MLGLYLPHDVQVGHSWLHHEHVGSFPYIPVHCSEGQASCSRRQLVAAAISKSWA